MKVMVAIRQTPILKGEVLLTTDEKAVDTDGFKTHINEWDLYALEESLRLQNENKAKVTAICVGEKTAQEALYYCIAAGVDEAVLIEDEAARSLDSWSIAALLAKFAAARDYDLLLTGLQSEDSGCAEVGGILATMLGIPQAAAVMKIRSLEEGKSIEVERELDEGYADIRRLTLPALLTVQTGINLPRYVSSMRLRKTRKKDSITCIPAQQLHAQSGPPEPKKSVATVFLPPIGSNGLELIEGTGPVQQADRLVSRLGEMGVI